MTTRTTLKKALLLLTVAVGMLACKKDNTQTSTPPTLPAEIKAMTFTELKALSTGASVIVPDAKKITGIVISDVSAKNIDSKTVIIQEAADKPGIIITFDAAQTFAVNDQVEIDISKQVLAQVSGEVILQNVPAAKAKKIGTGTIAAKTVDAATIIKDVAILNGTLVTLPAGTFSGASTYSGTLNYTDATGAIKSQVLTGALFENAAYPSSLQSLTGIVRVSGSTVFVNLRAATDAKAKAEAFSMVEDFTGAKTGIYWGAELFTSSPDFVQYDGKGVVTDLYIKNFGPAPSTQPNFGYYDPYTMVKKIKTLNATDPDANMLTPGRNYYIGISGYDVGYSLGTAESAQSHFSFYTPLDETKQSNGGTTYDNPPSSVTLIFAGSKTAASDYSEFNSDSFKNLLFKEVSDATVDYRVTIRGLNGKILAESAAFHDTGVWHTVNLNLEKEDIVNEAKKVNSLRISIESSKLRGTVTNWVNSGTEVVEFPKEFTTPIIVDKVIVNYSTKKPNWVK